MKKLTAAALLTLLALNVGAKDWTEVRLASEGAYPPVNFIVTDTAKEIPVTYTGILPDLFKEGKGAVVQGRLGTDGKFAATEVLAKHDENYMPPEAKHAVDQAQKAQAK